MNTAPIVLFVYNRPEHTQKTLDSLHKCVLADASTLYIFADGCKSGASEAEINNVKHVREIINSKKWCKEVIIIERNENLGLADSIVSGVTEIVNRYGKIIVLEDDLVLGKGFLKFMNDALDLYENEERVMHISGYMFPVKQKLPDTFFYNTASCWGWGTWSRAWRKYNGNTTELGLYFDSQKKIWRFNIEGTNPDFYRQLQMNIDGSRKTWAVKWYASIFINNGYSLHPGISLVRNIGNDGSGENSILQAQFLNQKTENYVEVKIIPLKESRQARKTMRLFYLQLYPSLKTNILFCIRYLFFNLIK